ncbi:NTP pyrophosphohydrolase [Streptomyces sp. BE303]|uniref:NTP pyrophosphohydrolase n=1 Tax=Streptomyces sp. BE303 TaxID=3002528 RepID=UPI002E75FE93|nr:NTP pyrophosphohydrolase [Streptomyces sp. BE303]MED7952929.1 NTP pyrophosphohydrolase [Streptomyces sp. BE303]
MDEDDTDEGSGQVPLLVVDAANVVGSVPDGWWRDRRRAAERLRDSLTGIADGGLVSPAGGPAWAHSGPLEVVLVVEGAARGVAPVPGVRVEAASGSGDDRIVDLVENALTDRTRRRCLVVTADRGLRARVTALGADVVGPRAVRPA